jgi:hypothetical protein
MIGKPCCIHLPPNTPLELTPLRVEQDRVDVESQIWLDSFPILSAQRSGRAFGRTTRNVSSHQRCSRPHACAA